MLRISQIPNPARSETLRETAAGGIDIVAPTVAPTAAAKAPNPAPEKALGANHAATVVPWVTQELRFHTVLDMGCGNGEAVRLLGEGGYEAHGIDIAPTAAPGIAGIRTGDALAVAQETGYFDLVLCCNLAHEFENARIPALLAEIDRLSNSYVMITTHSVESDAPNARTIAWWVSRIADFGWNYRVLREDPETKQLVLLMEKPGSLASKILPLLDEQGIGGIADIPAPAATEAPKPRIDTSSLAINAILTDLRAQRGPDAFRKIAALAEDLLSRGSETTKQLNPIFSRIVDAMEKRDDASLIRIFAQELGPILSTI